MSRVRKYVKGETFKSVSDLSEALERREYVFLGNRPCHCAWINNMSLCVILMYLQNGHLSRATINPEWKEPEDER